MSDCTKCDDDSPHPQRPEPKVTCKHDDLPHAEVPCEFKTLGTHWELRKEEGDCPLIRVLGEDGQPCWYRVCEVAEGEAGPEEDSPSIIYDCLGRYWKLQAGKDAAAIEQETDPATGAVTTTYTDPLTGAQTVWTIQPEVRFADENGDAYDPTTPTTPIKVARNPLMRCGVTNGTGWLEDCEGNRWRTYTERVTETIKISPAPGAVLDSTTPEGTVIVEACADLLIPDCGRNVTVTTEVSSNMTDFFEGSYVLRAQVSFTGPTGNFFNMATGGQDALQLIMANGLGNQTIRNLGEFAYTDFRHRSLPEGNQTVCVRLVLERNEIITGGISLGISDAEFQWTEEVHKAA